MTDELKQRRILLVGSRGYLGGRVASAMQPLAGISLSSLNRAPGSNPFEFQIYEDGALRTGDIREPSFFSDGSGYDVILSLAADLSKKDGVSDVTNLVLANSWLPTLIGALAARSGAHVIHVGTYSHKSDTEDYDPQTLYAATKRSGEMLLSFFSKTADMSATVLHTYDIYGPDQPHQRLIPSIIRCLRTGEKIATSPGKQEFRPVFVDDLVKLLAYLATEIDWRSGVFTEYDVYGPELFIVENLPGIIATEMSLSLDEDQVDRSMEYSKREIMKFRPCHDLVEFPGDWTTLSEGLKTL